MTKLDPKFLKCCQEFKISPEQFLVHIDFISFQVLRMEDKDRGLLEGTWLGSEQDFSRFSLVMQSRKVYARRDGNYIMILFSGSWTKELEA